ncbi:MAG: RNA methyltransferase [Clostridiaceae bacterium]|jgi:TrmH family RNA methyltransferase|nr:RNA methyltransferase [Clostridiaceae bacterium]
MDRLDEALSLHWAKVHHIGNNNPVIFQVRNLRNNKKPNPNKLFVIEGIWAFNAAISSPIEFVCFLLCPDILYTPELRNSIASHFTDTDYIYILSQKVFSSISERDKPDGFMALCKFKSRSLADIPYKDSIIMVLDGLEIPGNIGTIFRSCDGSNASAVFICNKKARMTHPKVIKGSMGGVFNVPFYEFVNTEDCIAWLRQRNFKVFLADTRSQIDYHDHNYTGNIALVAGSERYGIERIWYDYPYVNTVSIPMLGKCDSLNVAIASTIILYEIRHFKSRGNTL